MSTNLAPGKPQSAEEPTTMACVERGDAVPELIFRKFSPGESEGSGQSDRSGKSDSFVVLRQTLRPMTSDLTTSMPHPFQVAVAATQTRFLTACGVSMGGMVALRTQAVGSAWSAYGFLALLLLAIAIYLAAWVRRDERLRTCLERRIPCLGETRRSLWCSRGVALFNVWGLTAGGFAIFTGLLGELSGNFSWASAGCFGVAAACRWLESGGRARLTA